MIPTSPRGTIPSPTTAASRLPIGRKPSGGELRDERQAGQSGERGERVEVGERCEVEAEPDEDEEERREERIQRSDLLLEVVTVLRLGDDHAGEERSERDQDSGQGARRRRERHRPITAGGLISDPGSVARRR
ncbi:MAG TPA: hypothetical protein VK506_06880 [Conexibacter sp.]|nr:hypothetical protein [Conexibacter sp.]